MQQPIELTALPTQCCFLNYLMTAGLICLFIHQYLCAGHCCTGDRVVNKNGKKSPSQVVYILLIYLHSFYKYYINQWHMSAKKWGVSIKSMKTVNE